VEGENEEIFYLAQVWDQLKACVDIVICANFEFLTAVLLKIQINLAD
jgi:hypothetical protein